MGEANTWEMGPFKGRITTSNTVQDLSTWGTHITTQKAIATGAMSNTSIEISASGLQKAIGLYEESWLGQLYVGTNYNSNYAVNSVIYGGGGNAPENLGLTPGFPGTVGER